MTPTPKLLLVSLLVLAALPGCGTGGPGPEAPASVPESRAGDPHSFSRPEEVIVRHLSLEIEVDFPARRLHGRAELDIENLSGADRLFLDTDGLEITRVLLEPGGRAVEAALGPETPFLGRELSVPITPETRSVTLAYSTSPEARAIQWLDPVQTTGGESPFLFTQSQPVFARTWIPCQDTPSVRMTYDATVEVPAGLMALMSAENPTALADDGVYRFSMPQPVPSYLLALAVGDLEFRPLGPRTGVYAEPGVVEAAAWEFADVEKMMEATERLYGPYRWGRYDLLVLPPSFPYGGMENPRLTFATPTILAGDRSLVSLVAHELAHSWSGNLVTNSSWDDFWLNEGFTVYLEYRIMEELEGPAYAEMLRSLGMQDLRDELASLGPDSPDSRLALDLAGRDPDDGSTSVAYEKGGALLTLLERTWGRERWDAFLADYFDAHAFRSLDSEAFVEYLERNLFADDPALGASVRLDDWIHGTGLPDNAVLPDSDAFDRVEEQIAAWAAGLSAEELRTVGWTTHEWVHFLRNLPPELEPGRMAELDAAFAFTTTGNSEIASRWLLLAIRHDYREADRTLERFLTSIGRSKFLEPLYRELATTPEGRERAREIYVRAQAGYHPLAREGVERILSGAS